MPESIHSSDNQTKILLHMLPHVAFEGWTQKALEMAVIDAGFLQTDSYRAFSGHPRNALDFFFHWINSSMEQHVQMANMQNKKIQDRIEQAILIRLGILAPYKEAMHKTMQWLAHPVRLPLALKYLYQSVDSIWYTIGDTSVDFNFYTKRVSLAAVYSSTMLRWLTDNSIDNQVTQQFLNNRLTNVMQFHRFKHKIKSLPILNFKRH